MYDAIIVGGGHNGLVAAWYLAAAGKSVLVLERRSIAELLMHHGRTSGEPAAVVEWATTPRQRVVTAPLHQIAAESRAAQIEAPAVLVVGPTAALASELGTARGVKRVLVGAHG